MRAKRREELELTNNETLPTSTTEEETFDKNITTTEGNIEENGEGIVEEKARVFNDFRKIFKFQINS